MHHALFYSFLLLSPFISIECSKILGIFPSPGYSQFILCEKLMTGLASRGHEVTVISAFKPKEEVKNYRAILIDGLLRATGDNLFLQEDITVFSKIVAFYQFGNILTEYILAHKNVQELLHSNETFDLVIVERFGNEAHLGFSQHFKAPLILFGSTGLSEWNSHLVGNTRLPSIEPILFSPYTNHMTFPERLTNSMYSFFDILYKYLVAFPRQQELLIQYFPDKMNLDQIMYNASLLLLNSHPCTTHPSSKTSSVIEIGGFHIYSKKLPVDIQKFLDEAEEGAIFFSMGSNLKTTNLPNDTLNALLKVFSTLKQRVLWKFDGNSISNKPKNLLISKWLPQIDILGHPKVLAFITHGGLLSTTEAIYHGVPMVGIPIFGDQKMNVARSVQKGIAIHLPFKKLTEETIYNAIKEILDNPKYKENVKKNSNILRDQVVKPLDLAVYWIEYVIRHSGGTHLKNSSLELYWFQLYLIDVISFVLLSFVIFYYFIKLLVTGLWGLLKKDIDKKPAITKNKKKKTN